jgi:hypothetical protein
VTAVRVVQAIHAGASIESRTLDALAARPLPFHEVVERIGHGERATQIVLNYLRSKGAVTRAPGADGVYVWQLARTGAPA